MFYPNSNFKKNSECVDTININTYSSDLSDSETRSQRSNSIKSSKSSTRAASNSAPSLPPSKTPIAITKGKKRKLADTSMSHDNVIQVKDEPDEKAPGSLARKAAKNASSKVLKENGSRRKLRSASSDNNNYDPKDQFKKYPPRYLYNNRYKKTSDDENKNSSDEKESETKETRKAFSNLAKNVDSSKKIVTSAKSAITTINKLKFNLGNSEKKQDLLKIKLFGKKLKDDSLHSPSHTNTSNTNTNKEAEGNLIDSKLNVTFSHLKAS